MYRKNNTAHLFIVVPKVWFQIIYLGSRIILIDCLATLGQRRSHAHIIDNEMVWIGFLNVEFKKTVKKIDYMKKVLVYIPRLVLMSKTI